MLHTLPLTRLALAIGVVGALLGAPSVSARPLAQSDAATASVGPLGTFVSSVTVINPSTSPGTSTAQILFYNGSGALECTDTDPTSIAVGGTWFQYVPNITGCPEQNGGALPAGQYSAVVSASQAVYAVVSVASSSPSTGEQYNGVTTSGAQGIAGVVYLPSVLSNYYSNTSGIIVQNTGIAATQATIQLVNTSGVNTCVTTPSIAPNSSYTLDLGLSPLPNNFTLPAGFNGAATVAGGVEGTCGTPPSNPSSVAAVVYNYQSNETTSAGQWAVANAFASSGAGPLAYAAGLYNNYYGNYSSLIVQNPGTSPVNVTVQYSGPQGSATDAYDGLGANASKSFYTPNAGTCTVTGCGGHLPLGWEGSAVVTATGPILIQVNKTIGTASSMYSGANSGTANLFVPSLLDNYAGQNSALTIQNVDTSPATVQITWGTGCVDTFTLASGSTPGNGNPALIYIPNVNPQHSINGHTFNCTISTGYHSGATVTSLGGQKLVGLISAAGNGVYEDDNAPGQ